MHDGEGLTNGNAHGPADPPNHSLPTTNTVAIEVAAIDDDAMDTTPDVDAEPVLPNGSADTLQADAIRPRSPPTNGTATEAPNSNEQAPQAVPPGDEVSSIPLKMGPLLGPVALHAIAFGRRAGTY